MKRGMMRQGMINRKTQVLKVAACFVVAGLMAGCAGAGDMQMASAGGNCSSLRKELAQLDRRGLPSIIEAKNAGRKVSSKKQSLINRYNSVLNSYLSSKCHAK